MKTLAVFFVIFLISSLAFAEEGLPIAVDHSSEMPVPISQGKQGSCVAFAVAYLKTWQEAKEEGWDINDNIMSPAFIYNSLHNPDWNPGIYISDAMKFVCSNGICTLKDMPYDENDITTKPTLTAMYHASAFRAKSWYCIAAGVRSKIKAAIVKSPVVGELAGHAVCIVGYNDTLTMAGKTGYYKYINSYGPSWPNGDTAKLGKDGFGWISYDSCLGIYVMEDEENFLPDRALYLETNFASANSFFEDDYPNMLYLISGNDTIDSLTPGGNNMFLRLTESVDFNGMRIEYSYVNSTVPRTVDPNRMLKLKNIYLYRNGQLSRLNCEVSSDDYIIKEAYSAWFMHEISVYGLGLLTSSRDLAASASPRVYPNPCSDIVNIDGVERGKEISVYSINGSLVCKQIPDASKVEVSSNAWAPGTYLVRIGENSIKVIKR